MKEETKEKIFECFMKTFFAFLFVAGLLYPLYEPWANMYGKDYTTAWSLGVAFGFVFVPVLSWILYSILNLLIKIGFIKDDEQEEQETINNEQHN